MGEKRKNFKELDVMNNFMTNKLATHEAVKDRFGRLMMKALFGRVLGRIYIHGEYMIPGKTSDLRGIRMDVEIEEYAETGNLADAGSTCRLKKAGFDAKLKVKGVYDIEPHNRNDTHLPKRNRFYQALKDGSHLESGIKDFRLLPEMLIISIVPYDPFGYDRMVYTVRNRCDEVPELEYGDELMFIYFYTKGRNGGTKELGNFLRYLEDSREENAVDDNTRLMHELVRIVKSQPEMEEEYMTFGEFIDLERMDQAEETRREVTEEVTKKVTAEVTEKVTHDVTKSTKISSITELLEEYGTVSDEIIKALNSIDDMQELSHLLKTSARVGSIEGFAKELDKYFLPTREK